MVPPWVTAFHFLVGNKVAELKLTTFSSLLLFSIFLSFLLFWPPRNIVPLSADCWGYPIIIIINLIPAFSLIVYFNSVSLLLNNSFFSLLSLLNITVENKIDEKWKQFYLYPDAFRSSCCEHLQRTTNYKIIYIK